MPSRMYILGIRRIALKSYGEEKQAYKQRKNISAQRLRLPVAPDQQGGYGYHETKKPRDYIEPRGYNISVVKKIVGNNDAGHKRQKH